MNGKKAQINFFFLLMIGIVIFILALALAPVLTQSSNQTRTNLDCSNSSIGTDVKVTCNVVDLSTPFVVAIILGIGGICFAAKLIIG